MKMLTGIGAARNGNSPAPSATSATTSTRWPFMKNVECADPSELETRNQWHADRLLDEQDHETHAPQGGPDQKSRAVTGEEPERQGRLRVRAPSGPT